MQCLEAEKTKRKRKSSLKKKPFSPPQRNLRKPNPKTTTKLPSTTKQTSKLLIPMSAKPKPSPTTARSPHRNREMRKETSTTKQTSKLLIPMSAKPKYSPTTARSPHRNREMRKEADPSSIISKI